MKRKANNREREVGSVGEHSLRERIDESSRYALILFDGSLRFSKK